MEIKFADGIKIVVDDDKLLAWNNVASDGLFNLVMKDGGGLNRYDCDLYQHKFYLV